MVLSRIQLRRGTAAAWTAGNPILAAGEPGFELDTGQEKIGDGVTHWVDLPYGATAASVAAEATARAAGDATAVAAAAVDATAKVATETTARGAADTTLAGLIAAEATARANGDTAAAAALTAAIAAEITRANAAYATAPDQQVSSSFAGGVTDATTHIQSKIDACPDGGTVMIPTGLYKLTSALTITKRLTLRGAGVYPCFTSLNTSFAFDSPTVSPFLAGTVLLQTTAATDGIQITQAGAAVHLEDFGIRFADAIRFVNTGHGVNATPSTNYVNSGTGHDHGVVGAHWRNVEVFGHDGSHYAFRMMNPLLCTLAHIRGYGGGGLYVECDSYGGNYGNLLVDHAYFNVFDAGTAHGISLVPRTGSGTSGVLNLIQFNRPQVNGEDLTAYFPESTAPTTSQYLFRANSPFGVTGLSVIAPDLESPSIGMPVAFGGTGFIDPTGIVGKPSDTTSKAFPVMRSQFGATVLNSDLTESNVNTDNPTVATKAGMGSGSPTVTISGDDRGGTITAVMGTSPTAFSDLFTLTFGRIPSFATVFLMPANGNAAVINGYRRSATTNTITFGTGVAPTTGGTYIWNYLVNR